MTGQQPERYFCKVSRTAGFFMSPAGLKTRRSGGNANRSLTTWLNVPVVRRNVRVKFERSHKISHCSTSVGIWRVSVLFVLLSVLKNASEVARRALFASWFCGRPTTDDRRRVPLSPLRSTEIYGGEFVHSEQISGFKREFDPGSESTLAACLTHASRTRKSARMSTVATG